MWAIIIIVLILAVIGWFFVRDLQLAPTSSGDGGNLIWRNSIGAGPSEPGTGCSTSGCPRGQVCVDDICVYDVP